MTRTAAVIAVLGLVSAAHAQNSNPFTTGSTVSYSLDFLDVAGVPNGIIEPGEAAIIRITVSFSNQNTTTTYFPPAMNASSGTIRGFGSGHVDLVGVSSAGNANGVWEVDSHFGYGPQGQWDLYGPKGYGTSTAGGSILSSIKFGQERYIQSVFTTNPIHQIWQGLWIPSSYSSRTVTFGLHSGAPETEPASSIWIRFGPSNFQGLQVGCPSSFGSVSIPIVPAPAPLLPLLALGSTLAARTCRPFPARPPPERKSP